MAQQKRELDALRRRCRICGVHRLSNSLFGIWHESERLTATSATIGDTKYAKAPEETELLPARMFDNQLVDIASIELGKKCSLLWIAMFAIMGGSRNQHEWHRADCGQYQFIKPGHYCTVTPCEDQSSRGLRLRYFRERRCIVCGREGRDDCRTGYICDDSLGDTSVCIQDVIDDSRLRPCGFYQARLRATVSLQRKHATADAHDHATANFR